LQRRPNRIKSSVGAALRHRPTGRRTLLEPCCGIGQRDVELCWSRVAASANRMKNSVGAALRHRPTGRRTPLEPCCGIGQREVLGLHWGRVATLANDVSIRSVWQWWPIGRPQIIFALRCKIRVTWRRSFINSDRPQLSLCIVAGACRIEGFHNIDAIRTGAPTLLPKVWFINPTTTVYGGVKRSS
jgi:hypothetical protein